MLVSIIDLLMYIPISSSFSSFFVKTSVSGVGWYFPEILACISPQANAVEHLSHVCVGQLKKGSSDPLPVS